MTTSQVEAVAAEIAARRGDRVRRVHQDGRHRFRLALEGRGGRRDLVLDVAPDHPCAHLSEARPAPGEPSALAAGLGRRLRGARLEASGFVAGERALVLAFRRGEDGPALWFEGFGRSANLYLLDASGEVAITPRGDVAASRGASVGRTFRPAGPPTWPEPRAGEAASAEVASTAARVEEARDRARRRSHLRRWARQEARRAGRRVAGLQAALARPAEAEALQRRAEALQASLHRIRPGLRRVRVPDPRADPPAEVEVDLLPGLDPGEQVARLFRAARRARRAREEAEARLPAAREALARAEEVVDAAQGGGPLEALEAAARSLGAPPVPPEGVREPPRARPWRAFVSADGWRILVGRDAAGNDRLLREEARPQDLFLHVRGASGSHVLVPTPRGKTVPRDTLLDAAELACWFSARRGATRVEVDYAPRRYVRRPRGARPGLVRLERSRTLALRPAEDRRRRLLGGMTPP